MLVHTERLDVEDVVPLEERGVGLDALLAELRELASVPSEATGSVEIEHFRRRVAHVPEVMDDVRRREDVGARCRSEDLVSHVELERAREDVERVRVPLVEVGVDAASRVERGLEQRELGTVGLDRASLAGPQDDETL